MTSSKQHLKQLLNEDQEPFVLKNYIHEQRSLLNKIPRGVQKVKKQNSIRENLCRNVCFFSLQSSSSPIGTKSPLFDFSESQSKTPSCSRNSNSNTVFVHIPAGTAALLLEAAVRIQNQSEKQRAAAAAAAASKNNGFFGSILKRLRRRSKKNDSEFERNNEIKVCVRDILRWESQDVCRNASEEKTEQEHQEDENGEKYKESTETEEKRVSDVGLSSSSGWTESIEAKSIDLDTSTSSDEEEDAESSSPPQPNGDFYLCEKGSPFRFLLDTVLSPPRRRSPEFMSPATSPNRRKNQVENNVEGNLKKSDGQEEEKEYCSPVSVLEIQLDDNVDEQDEEEEYEDDSELERSFAFVHKAKQKLLQKLRRFERLAGLDPLDLEKRLTEDEDSNDDDGADEDGDEEDYEEESALNSNGKRSPEDMKKLLLHLMNEEGAVGGVSVGNKRCKRLGSLRNAERNMVNMMVEMDFRGEQKEWQRNSEHVEETVVAIEFGIFESLVEELSVELVES